MQNRFPEARKPAWRLWIDFGPAIGVRKSSAQITENHPLETLVGQQVAAVVNFPPRQIGPVVSEVLTLGFPDAEGKVVLMQPEQAVCRTAAGCSSGSHRLPPVAHRFILLFHRPGRPGLDQNLFCQ